MDTFPAGKGSLLVRDVFHCLGPLPRVSVNQWGRDALTLQDVVVGMSVEYLELCRHNCNVLPPCLCHGENSSQGCPCGWVGKESACSVGDLGLIPRLGRSPGERKGYPLQYSGLENSMDCIVHGVSKSRTWLNDFHYPHTPHTIMWTPGVYSCGPELPACWEARNAGGAFCGCRSTSCDAGVLCLPVELHPQVGFLKCILTSLSSGIPGSYLHLTA